MNEILHEIQQLKPLYEKEGFQIVGIFGSYARGNADEKSDVDIAYKIQEEFFKHYNGFTAASRIMSISKKLENRLHKKINLVSQ